MVLSWGRAHRFEHASTTKIGRLDALGPEIESRFEQSAEGVLAHGMGRSYGDVALNDGGDLVVTPDYDCLISADWETGIVRASAGLTLDNLLKICVPKGWFPPVSPGTKFVTLGGAVANDVHGKNHHVAGSFGAHVQRLKLIRSDRGSLECSRDENSELFALTLGGLGLTGIIEWVELQLKPIGSAYMHVENMACANLQEFFQLSEDSREWDYTVMWLDCFARGKSAGRGIFTRGRMLDDGDFAVHAGKAMTMPVTMPGWLLNRLTISCFNALYRRRPAARFKGRQHYDPFFYPLDGINDWNKLYGSKGFFQHQCIIPPDVAYEGISKLLEAIRKSGQGSFLAVLKVHGDEPSPGVMSFCREGASLALDFANRGKRTLKLLSELDAIVAEYGGRTYAAKDGRMSAEFFQTSYPRWQELEAVRDPKIQSSFWRRVTENL